MDRFEFKYLLTLPQCLVLGDRLRFLFRKDGHANTGGSYPVFSKYYDTKELRFFREKVDSEYRHSKIRIRTYGTQFENAEVVFLEGKFKEYDRQKKVRLPFHSRFLKRIQRNDLSSFRSVPDVDIMEKVIGDEMLFPSCQVYYEREAFFADLDGREYRLNFDRHISYLTASEPKVTKNHIAARSLLPPGCVVLEVKGPTEALPFALQNELRSISAKRITFSKYIAAMMRLGVDFNHSNIME